MAAEMLWVGDVPSLIWSVDGFAGAHLALSDLQPLAVLEGLVPLPAAECLCELVRQLTEQ
ncbi:hypothetical protein B484DRAFT_409512, partial [Ochromonadaceae sp. CCMP2298]